MIITKIEKVPVQAHLLRWWLEDFDAKLAKQARSKWWWRFAPESLRLRWIEHHWSIGAKAELAIIKKSALSMPNIPGFAHDAATLEWEITSGHGVWVSQLSHRKPIKFSSAVKRIKIGARPVSIPLVPTSKTPEELGDVPF